MQSIEAGSTEIHVPLTTVVIVLGAIPVTDPTVYGVGTSNNPIMLDMVTCSGRESRLIDCSSRGILVHSCQHFQDAGVSCIPGKITLLLFKVKLNKQYKNTAFKKSIYS